MAGVAGATVAAEREVPPTLTEGAELLDAFTAAAEARHRGEVAVVTTLGALVRAGVVEPLEALPVEVYLAVRHRWTRAERNMLLDAARFLIDMPATTLLWERRVISWSQVRAMITQLRRYGRPLRQELDARVAATDPDVIGHLDADGFEHTIATTIAELRPPDDVEADEQSDADAAYLAGQATGDGLAAIHAELDPVDAAAVLNAIDARAAHDSQVHGDRRADGKPMRRGQRRARALVNLCMDALAGGHVVDHNGRTRRRPAKPTMVVHVPLDRITESACGRLEIAVPGWLPTLTAKATEALAADADVRVVIFNGKRPLMVTKKLHAEEVPADTRLAVQARDLGARDPAGRMTVPLAELHHLGDDRIHDPDQIAVVGKHGHLRVIHRHGWTGRIDPSNGWLTWTHPTGRTITTLPWDTTLTDPTT